MESLRFLSADEARAAKETYGTPVYVERPGRYARGCLQSMHGGSRRRCGARRRGYSVGATKIEGRRRRPRGTAAQVYDADTLRARASEALAFPNAYGVTVRYAMKACPNGAVLRLFADMGLHFDASSTHEVRRAMAAGVPASRLSLSTQQLDDDVFELVRDHGLEVNACSLYRTSRAESLGGGEIRLSR